MKGDIVLYGWVISFALLFLTGSSVVLFLLLLAPFVAFTGLLLRYTDAADRSLDKFNNWIDKHLS